MKKGLKVKSGAKGGLWQLQHNQTSKILQVHRFNPPGQLTTTVKGKDCAPATPVWIRNRCPLGVASKAVPYTFQPGEAIRKSATGAPASKLAPVLTGTAIS